MVTWLVIASLLWPTVLASAAATRVAHDAPGFSAMVYVAASRICHQRPERSFHTAGVQWPVCGRCSGLYFAAPVGALLAAGTVRRRVPTVRVRPARHLVWWLAVASVPTILTVLLEWSGLVPISNLARLLAAVPLGAAIAFTLVRTAGGPDRPIEYTSR